MILNKLMLNWPKKQNVIFDTRVSLSFSRPLVLSSSTDYDEFEISEGKFSYQFMYNSRGFGQFSYDCPVLKLTRDIFFGVRIKLTAYFVQLPF